jgi:hypothetical protein
MGHQLSQKLPKDAGHFGSIMDMKKKHWFSVFLIDEISSNFDLYKGFLFKKKWPKFARFWRVKNPQTPNLYVKFKYVAKNIELM